MEAKNQTDSQVPTYPALITIDDAARLLSLGKTSVYELIRSKRLESVKIGKSLRIPSAAVSKFIESLRQSDGKRA